MIFILGKDRDRGGIGGAEMVVESGEGRMVCRKILSPRTELEIPGAGGRVGYARFLPDNCN